MSRPSVSAKAPGGMKKKGLPGFPGGPPFNWDSLKVTPDGPNPTSGTLAQDKIIPRGVKHYLSTLAAPRKQRDRIPPDEFALMVETYNNKFGANFPPDPMHQSWKVIWGTREAISRVAVGRWNSFLCKAGKGHCPHPGFFSGLGHFLSKAVSVVGKIPVLGSITKIATGPFQLAAAIASGQRLDKALLKSLKSQVNAVRDVAPYAQMVISVIPGVGTGIGAALGAAVALSKGRPITEALMAGIKGALPGGPLATAGFDTAMALAHGKSVTQAALEAARGQLPGPAQKAFDIGLAVVHGRKLQNIVTDALVSMAPAQVKDMVASGTKLLNATPGMLEAAKHITDGKALDGFKFASGLLGHSGINEEHLSIVRKNLSPKALEGFDAALDLQKTKIPWLVKVKAPVLEELAVPVMALVTEEETFELPPGAIPLASVGGQSYYIVGDMQVDGDFLI